MERSMSSNLENPRFSPIIQDFRSEILAFRFENPRFSICQSTIFDLARPMSSNLENPRFSIW